MYCAKCDRWEHDQIAVEDMICLRCYGPLVDPDEGNDEHYQEEEVNDLIWIGNALYPRWFVFAVIAEVAVVALVGIGTFLKWILS